MVRGAVGVLVVALGCALTSCQSGPPVRDDCAAAFVRSTLSGIERSTDLQLLDAAFVPGRSLTKDGQSADPEFAPDGAHITFVSGRGYPSSSEFGNERQSVYVMGVDGRNERRLTADFHDSQPTWSPDGSRIAFVRSAPSTRDEQLVVVVLDTAHVTVLTTGSLGGEAVWRSNDELVYSVWREDATYDLYRIGREGGASELIIAGLLSGGPVWNPDRSKFAFSRGYPASGVAVHDLATGDVADVPESDSAVAQPLMWTADDYLLFTQNVRGPTFNIAASRSGTSEPTVVSEGWRKLYDAPQAANPQCQRQA